jgi:hypothetical protein
MRERGSSTVGTILLAGLAGLLTAGLMMDWMIVDVRATELDGVPIIVPFPLWAAEAAVGLASLGDLPEMRVPEEMRQQRELITRAAQELLACPDGNLVQVKAPDTDVQILKQGDVLRIMVNADGAKVQCAIPLDGVVDMLESWDWKTFDPSMVFDVLSHAPNGHLVYVDAEEAKVAISIL